MIGGTTGPGVATCTECATPFTGLVCPTCRQRLEAFEVDQLSMIRPDGTRVVLAERSPDPLLDALVDEREVA